MTPSCQELLMSASRCSLPFRLRFLRSSFGRPSGPGLFPLLILSSAIFSSARLKGPHMFVRCRLQQLWDFRTDRASSLTGLSFALFFRNPGDLGILPAQ